MNNEQLSPTLRVYPKDVSKRALVVGDPNRVQDAAIFLENTREIGFFREYRTVTGEYKGKRITISSHGVGSAGANMCFHELFNCGVTNIIRAGTCGAMKKEIQDGELIIASGAIREDGTSERMAPMSFPAIADRHVVQALENAALEHGVSQPHVGLALTQAYFYPGILPSGVDYWVDTKLAMAVEMEIATLLVMASLRGVRAGGILTSDGNMTREADPDAYDPHRDVVDLGKKNMLEIAIKALCALPD
ncbi:MAG: nucleoside phosphorylase [Anaerolineaceae bacterium]|nr:nucleoside phosphorylase [Anaerolineaceae bacterium]